MAQQHQGSLLGALAHLTKMEQRPDVQQQQNTPQSYHQYPVQHHQPDASFGYNGISNEHTNPQSYQHRNNRNTHQWNATERGGKNRRGGDRSNRGGNRQFQSNPVQFSRQNAYRKKQDIHSNQEMGPKVGPAGERIWQIGRGVYMIDGDEAYFKHSFIDDPWLLLVQQKAGSQHSIYSSTPS
ncbi:hypothetical protein BDV3_006579 [Batrachochytrium dendrobatidis]|nr:hypothetical protein O5D80_002693 [Batrachochytrium dendrobatidis]KAK5668665.1 hypothetical protein QVD99_004458 [Batrachochytrium dendrobatidis]